MDGRQYRRIDSDAMMTRDFGDDGNKEVRGYASTFNQPYELARGKGWRVLEQIDPQAFDKCDMSDVIMQYDHMGRVFARTSNGTLTLTPDARGLAIWANLGGTEGGRQLFEEIRGGYISKMSFGFSVGEDRREEQETHETGEVTLLRTILSVRKLYDVSAVSLPANDATEISVRSCCDGWIAELTEERRKRAEAERRRQKIKIMLNL